MCFGIVLFLCMGVCHATTGVAPYTSEDLVQRGTRALQEGHTASTLVWMRRAQHKGNVFKYWQLEKQIRSLKRKSGHVIPPLGWQVFIVRSLIALPLLLWQFLFVLFLLLVFLKGWKWLQARAYIRVYLIVFFLLAAGMVLAMRYKRDQTQRGVVSTSTVLRSGPGAEYAKLATLAPLSECVIVDAHQQQQLLFYKVFSGILRGWVAADAIEQY